MTTKAHVYIIEDDPTMIGLLKTLLDMEGYQVSTFVQNETVSIPNLLAQSHPDVLLMDVNLRNLDGMEVLQQLKADSRLDFLKIIMSSGSDYTDICLKYGADKFLLKPYMPEDLIQMIRGLSPSPLN